MLHIIVFSSELKWQIAKGFFSSIRIYNLYSILTKKWDLCNQQNIHMSLRHLKVCIKKVFSNETYIYMHETFYPSPIGIISKKKMIYFFAELDMNIFDL